jgi:hypothetical protein
MKNRKEPSVNVIYKDNPVMLDKVLQDIQIELIDNIKWLNYAFGRAYKLVEHRPDGNKFIYPAVYNGKGEYVSVLPNDNFGNFSWFDIYDPQNISYFTPGMPQIEFNGALVFWYNLNSIYEDTNVLYTEEIKNEIISLITTPGFVKQGGRITLGKVYERYENVYKNYSIEKIYNNYAYKGEGIASIDKQFFMYPYAALRLEFSIVAKNICKNI